MDISNKVSNKDFIEPITNFFMNNISSCNLKPYFNICVSENIVKDCMKYDKTINLNPDTKYAGLVILPSEVGNKIQILISQNSCTPDTILHELTHMYDFVNFSNYFCKGELHKVKEHKYYQTFIYWSEFHAKLIDIPYFSFLLGFNKTKDEIINEFTNNVKSFYYPEYTKKFLNKQNIGMTDIMWYLGELTVCKLYDQNNVYDIPENIIHTYGQRISELYNLLFHCLTFEDFVKNIQCFHDLVY